MFYHIVQVAKIEMGNYIKEDILKASVYDVDLGTIDKEK